MAETIFLAGATGAIGRKLVPLLIEAGFTVHGTTRKPDRADSLRAIGATPVVVDVFDAEALKAALLRVKPDIVIHQLTDLPFGLDPAQMEEGRIRNARIREVGTKNLVDAAVAAGTRRMISQSIAWSYQAGISEITEETPLVEGATAVRTLEALTLTTAGIAGTVLRYGLLYGPGTGCDAPSGAINLHVDDAAHAALLAVQTSAVGVFNVVEEGGPVSNAKAKSILGWQPFRRGDD
ncbi:MULTISPECIES: NAD(P)-dependent oxidoreductase [unclassified Rhizobium]|jgi:nucleoside-diphosphate-sugar epimerase|uniref:NAD-dependent epimerase/dehydratase family protein n=1 Tax=unclassified Rhizobium TaxID=2613769 RepID=UPI00064550CA|nr:MULTISPECIES: NAD(P)-dependent oxidoreductase [unclassified Rhizobium]MBN8950446.1 NAD(P)-dependent oxidoreductase [Rhizobium tropici]OJY68968.1 MAG: dTDP-glucose 4,6-dehydratase [Rhizobium sp. 60-20]RKD74255.1 nucleoside-diphosphate-sugar epimerase [Rhizobium sp. WW_1]